VAHKHAKIKFIGYAVENLDWKQTDGQADMIDFITVLANVVGKHRSSFVFQLNDSLYISFPVLVQQVGHPVFVDYSIAIEVFVIRTHSHSCQLFAYVGLYQSQTRRKSMYGLLKSFQQLEDESPGQLSPVTSKKGRL